MDEWQAPQHRSSITGSTSVYFTGGKCSLLCFRRSLFYVVRDLGPNGLIRVVRKRHRDILAEAKALRMRRLEQNKRGITWCKVVIQVMQLLWCSFLVKPMFTDSPPRAPVFCLAAIAVWRMHRHPFFFFLFAHRQAYITGAFWFHRTPFFWKSIFCQFFVGLF